MNTHASMVNTGMNVGQNNSGPPSGVGSKGALEAYTREELDDDQLIAALLLSCRTDSETTWDALSLLDQYHRRGLLETSVFLAAKTELNMLVFSSQRSLPTFRTDAARRSSAPSALDQFSSGMLD